MTSILNEGGVCFHELSLIFGYRVLLTSYPTPGHVGRLTISRDHLTIPSTPSNLRSKLRGVLISVVDGACVSLSRLYLVFFFFRMHFASSSAQYKSYVYFPDRHKRSTRKHDFH